MLASMHLVTSFLCKARHAAPGAAAATSMLPPEISPTAMSGLKEVGTGYTIFLVHCVFYMPMMPPQRHRLSKNRKRVSRRAQPAAARGTCMIFSCSASSCHDNPQCHPPMVPLPMHTTRCVACVHGEGTFACLAKPWGISRRSSPFPPLLLF